MMESSDPSGCTMLEIFSLGSASSSKASQSPRSLSLAFAICFMARSVALNTQNRQHEVLIDCKCRGQRRSSNIAANAGLNLPRANIGVS